MLFDNNMQILGLFKFLRVLGMGYHKVEFVHQVLILEDGGLPNPVPDFLEKNILAIKKVYPKAKHRLWSSKEIREFLRCYFSLSVLKAYDTLAPFSYKADLARYALLYIYGGMYVDIGVRLLRPWNIPLRNDISAFRDVSFVSPSWSAIQTGLLWALPGREEFSLAIKWIVENCNNRFYGKNPLYPTGPVLLGRAFLKVMASRGNNASADDQYVGLCRCVTPEVEMLNVVYISREGDVVALRNKKKGGDIKHLGFSKGNNYNDIWDRRQVYSERVLYWKSNDEMIRITGGFRKRNGILTLPSGKGMTYGPYVTLRRGQYILTIRFSGENLKFNFKVVLTSEYGHKIHEKYFVTQSFLEGNDLKLHFGVKDEMKRAEFKIYSREEFIGGIDAFFISDISLKQKIKSISRVRIPFLSFS
ncbi:hypothetical protein NQF86_02935 [Bombella sp. TMW 2.2543]|uniref:Uncharacterized protein n=1 Tax=Bombella pluederhausensis TaxID=2967336 RepID=A0ABT3WG18_9PROT|nr:glycosyltransferase [Bombella pluederhausensis]MCX5617628.1 hypothetical protein [Bombella pluederhausensis]